jgi:hypothetical protein
VGRNRTRQVLPPERADMLTRLRERRAREIRKWEEDYEDDL